MKGAMQRPLSVAEIATEASSYNHSTQYPLRIALRTAQNMLNAASACQRTGNTQDEYLFLFRHADFCMAQIASHPERKQPEFKADVSRATKQVRENLEKMEKLKPQIQARYDRWKQSMDRAQAAQDKARGASGTQDAGYFQILDAGEHKDLALQLANGEMRRRQQNAGAERREFEALAQNIKNLGRRMDGPGEDRETQRATTFNYPGVTGPHQLDLTSAQQPFPPAVPAKGALADSAPVPPPKTSPGPLASSDYTFRSTAKSEDGTPLRPIFLPAELRASFLRLAAANTSRNLETCGILCGSLISNALFISHLVVPAQTSTSDTCDTTEAGDAALFDYVDARALLVCGWIHTHPSQTCFLSSRDLHTHAGYQVMLPEAVAIVCAPSREPDHGVFRLTDPPGKQAILSCTKQGLFHPHETGNLYTDALKPGHVSELKGLRFEVVDMRDG